ncbi:MAG TPA: tRNA guanosine(34) transglycosylase Tgt [Anaerolineales bacterium]|nr:tRNA guanosine(34) transglycosylase Tgt [Anaerolineales bacterium]
MFEFDLVARSGHARAGVFHTPHGDLLTPVFAPVGTQGTVKALTPAQLTDLGASLVLANTYHLYLRPGDTLVKELGGLHEFMQWHGPILTDSGGFQVFSLSDTRKIDDDGVTFKSHLDGAIHRFTPEKTVEIQNNLGADIIMAFDECPPPLERKYVERSLIRTHAWAERCRTFHQRSEQALFGIVQGGIFPDLREQSARFLMGLDFPGYAIGGLAVGETKEQMHATIECANAVLPGTKPRYLMGVGSPEDLVNGVMRGVDIFDCVLPTRLARNAAAMTRRGRLNMKNAQYARDHGPVEEGCACYCCSNFTRAYVRHLSVAEEILAAVLLTIHNVHLLLTLMREMRAAIIEGTFDSYAQLFLQNYRPVEQKT